MFSHAHLPNSVEALINAMYVVNLSPSVPLAGDISQRIWPRKEVSYKHLKVFGCRESYLCQGTRDPSLIAMQSCASTSANQVNSGGTRMEILWGHL